MLSDSPLRTTAPRLRSVLVFFAVVSFALTFAILTDSGQGPVALAKSGAVIQSDAGKTIKAESGKQVGVHLSINQGAPLKAQVEKLRSATPYRHQVPPQMNKIRHYPPVKRPAAAMARQAPGGKAGVRMDYYEPNNTPSEAYPISLPIVLIDPELDNYDDWSTEPPTYVRDADWYMFTVSMQSTVEIGTRRPVNNYDWPDYYNDDNTHLRLLRDSNPGDLVTPLEERLVWVAANNSFGGSPYSRLVQLNLEPGDYYLRVVAGNRSINYSFPYELYLDDAPMFDPNQWGRITGRITDEFGTGIHWVGVRAHEGDPYNDWNASDALTDESGNFIIYTTEMDDPNTDWDNRWYVNTSNDQGYVDQWWPWDTSQPAYAPWQASELWVYPPSEIGGVNLALALGGSLAGYVKDNLDNPIAGARVELNRYDFWRDVWTDETGHYEFFGIPTGTDYTLWVDPPWDSGLMFEYYDNKLTPWEADRITIYSDPEPGVSGNDPIDFVLDKGGTVSGVITDQGGTPVNARVMAIRASEDPRWAANNPIRDTMTYGDGSYMLSGLPYDDYKILARPEGTASPRANPGQTQADFREQGLAYSFHAEDAVGRAIGVARFSKAARISIQNSDPIEGIDIPLPEGSTIEGRVTEQSGRDIQEGVNLSGYFSEGFQNNPELAANGWVNAGMGGWYSISGVPPENYIMVAGENAGQYIPEYYNEKSDPSQLGSEDVIPIFAGGAVVPGINFTLEPAATIRGKVTDADGNLIDWDQNGWSDAWIGLLYPDGTVVQSNTSNYWFPDYGKPDYYISGIKPGQYIVFATAPGYGMMFFDPISRQATSNYQQASPLKLQGGAVVPGVDFALSPAEPSVELTGNYSVDDLFTAQWGWDPMGDGDGILEAGEWVLIQPEITNTGNAYLNGIRGEVWPLHQDVLVDMDGGFWIENLAPGATVSAADIGGSENGIFSLALKAGVCSLAVEFHDNLGQMVGSDTLIVPVAGVDQVPPLMFLASVAKSSSQRAQDILSVFQGEGDEGPPLNAFGGHFKEGESAYLGVMALDPSGLTTVRAVMTKKASMDAIIAWAITHPTASFDDLIAAKTSAGLDIEEVLLAKDPALTDSLAQDMQEGFVGAYLGKYTVPAGVEDDFILGLWGKDHAATPNETRPGLLGQLPTWANGRKIFTTKVFRPTAGMDILLVSDDRQGESLNFYTDALDAGGYDYDIWSRMENGQLTAEMINTWATAATPHRYPVMIWYMGGHTPTLSQVEQDAVKAHLQAGGKLFITDQDLAWDMTENTPYGQKYNDMFKAFFINDWSGSWQLSGSDHPVSAGMQLTIHGGDGASNQDSPDVIGYDQAYSTPLFFYQGGDGSATGGQIGAVATEYSVGADLKTRIVNFAFGFEAIDNGEDRAVLMDRVIAWLTGSAGRYVLYGDVSANGRVQAFDAALILQHVVGIKPIPQEIWSLGDVDGSGGEPTALDAALILQFVAKLIDVFPVLARVSPAAPERSIAFTSEVAAESGQEIAVPLRVGGDRPVLSAQLALRYDPTVLKFESVKLSPDFAGFLEAHKADNGLLKLALAGDKAIAPGKIMADLVFSVIGPDGSNSQLTFESFRINDQAVETADAKVAVGANLPRQFALSQNYPNPFNPETVIAYALPEESHVVLDIYNISGQMVRRLVDQRTPAGFHKIRWDGKDMQGHQTSSGVYFYQIKAGSFSATKKMTVLK